MTSAGVKPAGTKPAGMRPAGDTGLALRFAWREMRGGIKGLRLLALCLGLGVAAIAGVGSLTAAVEGAIARDAQSLLGGDLLVRLTHRPASPEERAALAARGTLSETVEMRALARGGPEDRRTLVELQALDPAYPLYGRITLAPAMPLTEALAERAGIHGAVVERAVLARLGFADPGAGSGIGAKIRVGDATFEVRAVFETLPDRGASAFGLGPRLAIADAALPRTGLVQPGSLVTYEYRLRLPPDAVPARVAAALGAAFPEAGWITRTAADAAPGLRRQVDRLSLFLTLVGLSALLVGGIGVSNAVTSYLERRTTTIAIMKCLGAPAGLVLRIYLIQVLMVAALAIAGGALLGGLAPALAGAALADILPVRITPGTHLGPLALAALFGLLTALAFALWPLGRARETSPSGLFRDLVVPAGRRPRRSVIALTVLTLLALAALAVASAGDRTIAAWFVVGATATLALLRITALGLQRLARSAARTAGHGLPGLRLALANIARPGAPTVSIVTSLGAGLAVLVAIALIEANIARQLQDELPAEAPSFFFIDIQPDQIAPFLALARATPGVRDIEHMPSLRGRITGIDGVPVESARVAAGARWATASDRGLTYTGAMPTDYRLVAGSWWPPDYRGAPAISLDARIAQGMGLGIGSTLTVNVLGRNITARIMSLREVNWQSLGLNFTIVFAPGVLEGAPHTYIATAYSDRAAEEPLFRAVSDRFANITAIRVRDALDAVAAIIGDIGLAIRATAAVTLAAGLLVLASAVATGRHHRTRDAIILKVLGATRRDVLGAFLIEYGLIGLLTGLIAVLAGALGSWAVVVLVMHGAWSFLPGPALETAWLGFAAALVFGFAGTFQALGRKAAPYLRNP